MGSALEELEGLLMRTRAIEASLAAAPPLRCMGSGASQPRMPGAALKQPLAAKPITRRRCGVPRSPLEAALWQMADAEEAWAAERAAARREAEDLRKRNARLERELRQLQAARHYEASEAAALKAALRMRQTELDAALSKAAAARAADGSRAERLQQQLAEAMGDREELGALLSKALAQLEAASAAAQEREAAVATLEARVAVLETDHNDEAADGEQECARQGELLERLLGTQLDHNRARTQALREALSAHLEPDAGDAAELHGSSPAR
ncbi:hypothetical protein WJX81_001072 [Elliptochloris bilobata]|uniref:Uncharacterized protein n=1 Tax=Elliptochloris bilobata TaxID=381761 RepID=A0AAW1RDA8_9CHLO